MFERAVELDPQFVLAFAELGRAHSMMFNIGAFLGIYSFSRVTQLIGRRPTFAIFFSAAFVTTIFAFLSVPFSEGYYISIPC